MLLPEILLEEIGEQGCLDLASELDSHSVSRTFGLFLSLMRLLPERQALASVLLSGGF